jgi:hypothetical protein
MVTLSFARGVLKNFGQGAGNREPPGARINGRRDSEAAARLAGEPVNRSLLARIRRSWWRRTDLPDLTCRRPVGLQLGTIGRVMLGAVLAGSHVMRGNTL